MEIIDAIKKTMPSVKDVIQKIEFVYSHVTVKLYIKKNHIKSCIIEDTPFWFGNINLRQVSTEYALEYIKKECEKYAKENFVELDKE